MWACDYIYHYEAFLPLKGFELENGVSVSRMQGGREEYIFPKAKPVSGVFDFENLSFLQRAMEANSLDSIGTMGMNLAECYNLTGKEELMSLLN